MSTNKKIAFVVVLLIVIGSIWYLENLKVHPTSSSGGNQAINIGSTPNVTIMRLSMARIPSVAPVRRTFSAQAFKQASNRLPPRTRLRAISPQSRSPIRPDSLTPPRHLRLQALWERRWSCWIFGHTVALTACVRSRTSMRGIKNMRLTGWRSSAFIPRSSISRKILRTFRTPSRNMESIIRSSWIATMAHGMPITIFTGRMNI